MNDLIMYIKRMDSMYKFRNVIKGFNKPHKKFRNVIGIKTINAIPRQMVTVKTKYGEFFSLYDAKMWWRAEISLTFKRVRMLKSFI